ncbi:SDR family NAD(P)-dependent oxidoreductase [Roseobacter weihaiensis]|uniref:SDR family NAD(P)-dependent oxidoreductase n=1 Tax=Roseobacter weihaiensis TaxID=2763262 RepID=UPI001D0ACA26|nr:SDR family oxidoreductase [Roseobacter sp. H9]
MKSKTALITGGSRGVGFAICRQLARQDCRVLISTSDPDHGQAAVAALSSSSLQAEALHVDLANAMSIEEAYYDLEGRDIAVDVLVHAAGVFPTGAVLKSDPDQMIGALSVNVFGAMRLAHLFMPGMIARGYGRVVHITHAQGEANGGLVSVPSCMLSLGALNALTLCLAAEAAGDVTVNAVYADLKERGVPGAVAGRSLAETAATVVWLIEHPEGGPNGRFLERRGSTLH